MSWLGVLRGLKRLILNNPNHADQYVEEVSKRIMRCIALRDRLRER